MKNSLLINVEQCAFEIDWFRCCNIFPAKFIFYFLDFKIFDVPGNKKFQRKGNKLQNSKTRQG